MTRAAKVASSPPAAVAWRSRIVGYGEEPPAELIANPSNWRTHPEAQRAAIRGALDVVGWVASVTVNRTSGHVVDGHARIEEAIARREKRVPITYVELSVEEEALVLASLDPIAAMAVPNQTKLAELLAGITVQDAGLVDLLRNLGPRPGRTDPDEIPEVTDSDVFVKPGESYRLGDHRLLCGDATDPTAVARLLDSAKPRLLVTDPPYGIELDMEWRDGVFNGLGPAEPSYMRSDSRPDTEGAARASRGRRGRSPGHRTTKVSGDTVADWSAAFALVPSIEVAYVWHATAHMLEVASGLERLGFELRQQIVWVKSQAAISRSAYNWQHEPAWYAVRRGATAEWIGDARQTTVWELASPKQIMGGSKEEKFDHPTQKPAECMARPIRNHRGDVYEPFAGSGTTIIAAEQLRRHCYAMEIEPKYVQVAIERWQAFTGELAERI